MAFRLALVYFVLLLALLFVVEDLNDCHKKPKMCFLAEAATLDNKSRKLLHGLEEVFKKFNIAPHGSERDVGWSLRAVPSGPDPLHHNSRDPKKPQTP